MANCCLQQLVKHQMSVVAVFVTEGVTGGVTVAVCDSETEIVGVGVNEDVALFEGVILEVILIVGVLVVVVEGVGVGV